MDKLKKRANKQARELVLKKLTRVKVRVTYQWHVEAELEKKLDKKKAVIQKIAKKLLPKVRKAEIAKKKAVSLVIKNFKDYLIEKPKRYTLPLVV